MKYIIIILFFSGIVQAQNFRISPSGDIYQNGELIPVQEITGMTRIAPDGKIYRGGNLLNISPPATGTVRIVPDGNVYRDGTLLNLESGNYTSLFSEDFEGFNLGKFDEDTVTEYYGDSIAYLNWVNDSTNTIVDSIGLDGESSRMLMLRWPADTEEDEAGMEYYIRIGEQDEVYLSFQVKWMDSTQWGDGGFKMMGISGMPWWTGFLSPVSGEGFTAWMFPGRMQEEESYIYHHSGDAHEYGFSYKWGAFRIQNNRWYTITERVFMNTFTGGNGNFDGGMECFVNERKLWGRYDFMWMEDEHDTMKIDAFTMVAFMAKNPDGTYDESYTLIDNIEVYTLDSTFASNHSYAWGMGDTNALGEYIYIPTDEGTNTDNYDSVYTTSTGTFKDANGGGDYDIFTEETYKIYVSGADSILLTVDTALVEDNFDIFQVINDETTVTPNFVYSQKSDTTEAEYMIDGENVIIRLGSDYLTNSKGFQVTWESY